MAGPHAHDDDGQHEVTPTDAPTAGIGLYFGTQTGKTEIVCGIIKDEFGDAITDATDVAEGDLEHFSNLNGLICGIPTWNTGALELRSGTVWDDLLEKIGELDLKGKPVALFGLGDMTYRDTFAYGGKKFADLLDSLNATKIGDPFYHDASDGTLPEEVAVDWFINNIKEHI